MNVYLFIELQIAIFVKLNITYKADLMRKREKEAVIISISSERV